jgi:replicative DNA helicase
LMAEDDASLIELAEGGTIAGLTLDDIEKMTSNELRAALRESRAEHKADADLLDETTKKYRQLKISKRASRHAARCSGKSCVRS